MAAPKILVQTLNFLKAHPIICLLLLSPGIPEYLTGSSKMTAAVFNPLFFLLQIAINLGLYGPEVLLVREATVRWKKGWATILALGAAYAILEEGIALATLYNPLADPVEKLGVYGHALGVNWVWTAGIIPAHMIFSIALPILLLSLALPETNGKSLITSKNKIAVLFVILALDVCALFLVVFFGQKFWMGWPIFIISLIAIGVLIFVAKYLPANMLHAKTQMPKISAFGMGVFGVLFYVVVFFVEQLGVDRIPAVIDVAVLVVAQVLFLVYALRVVGRQKNLQHLVAFAAGLVAPLAFFGFVSQLTLPLVLFADLAFALFIAKLMRKSSS